MNFLLRTLERDLLTQTHFHSELLVQSENYSTGRDTAETLGSVGTRKSQQQGNEQENSKHSTT